MRINAPQYGFREGMIREKDRCGTKAKYATEGDAIHDALRYNIRNVNYNAKALRTYQCDLCQKWHLTSREPA